MIKSLFIQNYALIQSLEMQPSANLNIITGETGAGKSIMLGAVGLLLGNRADTKTLFTDSEKCVVEGVFDLESYQIRFIFDAADLDYDHTCIIRREISPNGKSRAFVNDIPVTLDVLKGIGEKLVDIHSQHENLHLGDQIYQLDILDVFGGLQPVIDGFQLKYQAYTQTRQELLKLEQMARASTKDADYKSFLLQELKAANLDELDQTALEEELKILENAELIKRNLAGLTQLMDESEYSVLNQLKEGVPLLSSIKGFSGNLAELLERYQSATIELRDIANELAIEQDHTELDPEKLEATKEKLDLLYRLQQKHQVLLVSDLCAIRDQLEEELETVNNLDDRIAKARKAFQQAEAEMLLSGRKLSEQRRKVAPELSGAIEQLVHQLGIENGKLHFEFETIDAHDKGIDLVELHFSANKGIEPKPLRAVASGGEFSRLIFAIKYLLADKTALPTIIFDEIDTGVSGDVAMQMIQMMKSMSQRHQVIAISHLPQFAAGGHFHYFVYKDHSSDKSVSKIKKLAQEERIVEIAKMIGGKSPGESALQSARDLLSANIS